MNYEELFDLFVCNCGLPNDEIPQDNDEVYRYIKNAITLYNQKTKKYRDILATPLKANELDETISCDSDNEFREDQEGLILVNLLKYMIAILKSRAVVKLYFFCRFYVLRKY